MARKTVIELVDDISGDEASQTVTFGLDGVGYEIDLSDENATRLREDFAHWVSNGRRVAGRRQRGTGNTSSRSRETALIREWAKNNGYDIADRGRVSASIREAYAAAH